MCPKGVTRVQECASQRNPSKVCQLEGGGVGHVLPGLEGRAERWGAGMCLETLSIGTYGQPVKLKTPPRKSDIGLDPVSKQVGVSVTALCGEGAHFQHPFLPRSHHPLACRSTSSTLFSLLTPLIFKHSELRLGPPGESAASYRLWHPAEPQFTPSAMKETLFTTSEAATGERLERQVKN